MNKKQKQPTRRNILEGAAALLATAVAKPSVGKLLQPPATAIAATVEEEIVRLYPFMKTLFLVMDKHKSVGLIKEENLKPPKEGSMWADNDECYGRNVVCYPAEYWTRMRLLQVKWANDIGDAANNLRLCDEFDETIAKSDKNKLAELINLTGNFDNYAT